MRFAIMEWLCAGLVTEVLGFKTKFTITPLRTQLWSLDEVKEGGRRNRVGEVEEELEEGEEDDWKQRYVDGDDEDDDNDHGNYRCPYFIMLETF